MSNQPYFQYALALKGFKRQLSPFPFSHFEAIQEEPS